MEIVDPRIDPRLVPDGSKPVVLAEHQAEYQDLPSVRTPDGQVITRWSFNEEERRRILAGQDLYVTILSHGSINPLFCTVGPVDWTRTMDPVVEAAQQAAAQRKPITVREIEGRICQLSCGHRIKQGEAYDMPVLGAEAYCPICSPGRG